MKKNIRFILVFILLIGLYAAFLFWADRTEGTGELPVITVPDTVLEVSVSATDEDLLEGVTASDVEDGDLTSRVFVESISAFDQNRQRTVTYAVFDQNDNITHTTRLLQYTDYAEPEITLTGSLCLYYLDSTEQLKNYVSATSSVDGDISSRVSITRAEYDANNNYVVDYSVTDSCGITSTFSTNVTWLNTEPTIEITLTDYMLRVNVGTPINALDFIDTITDMGVTDNTLMREIEVSSDYNRYQPGTYEVIYRINRSNSEYGITKMIIIVEE